MAKYLFVSYDGLIADIAWECVKEGEDVRFWIKDPEEKEIADGFVPKSEDWKKDVGWADVVVFDDVLGMGEMAQEVRQAGVKVVGGSPYTDKLEDDRGFGQQELKAAGVSIIPQQKTSARSDTAKRRTRALTWWSRRRASGSAWTLPGI